MRALPVPSFGAAAEAELLIAARWESTDSYHREPEAESPQRKVQLHRQSKSGEKKGSARLVFLLFCLTVRTKDIHLSRTRCLYIDSIPET